MDSPFNLRGLQSPLPRRGIAPQILIDFDFVNATYSYGPNLQYSDTFANIFTFSRTSSATYIDSSGVIQTASSGVARFGYDPETLTALGVLVEDQRVNYMLHSSDVANGLPTDTDLTMTVSADAVTAPDGSSGMDKIYPASGTGVPGREVDVTIPAASSYTFSIFAKAAGWNRIGIRYGAAAGDASCTVDLSDGSIVGFSGVACHVKAFPNDVYRIDLSGDPSTTTCKVIVEAHNTGVAGGSETASGTNGIYIWGWQLEDEDNATSYIPTTTTTVTRQEDDLYWDPPQSWFLPYGGTVYAEHTGSEDGSSRGAVVVGMATDNNDEFDEALEFDNRYTVGYISPNDNDAAYKDLTYAGHFKLISTLFDTDANLTGAAINGTLTRARAFDNPSTTGAPYTRISFGMMQRAITGQEPMNGHLKAVKFWNYELTEAEMQTETT